MHQIHLFRKQAALLVILLSVVALVSAGTISEAAPPQQAPEPSPLRVMVPTDQTWAGLEAQGHNSLFEVIPNLTAESFRPGPRMPILNRVEAAAKMSSGPNAVMAPTTFRTLAILVDFSDNPATAPAAYFDTLLFGTSTSKTMKRFYGEASYGLLDIVTVNLPSALGWKRMPQSYSYYVGTNNCTGSYPNNCQKLTEDAVNAVKNIVNFANYDNDGDGYVDTVFIIHAGPGAEASGGDPNMIWSHSWWVPNGPVLNGVRIGSYTTEPEYWFNVSGSTSDMTHGVYAHELGHALGLPDLYDVDYSSDGVGKWSMMSGGSWNGYNGDTPAQFDAWSRKFLGFNDPVNITGANQTITIPNVLQNQNNSIFRLNGANAKEYWLLENRQKLGSDAALPGSGLLIWHIDENVGGSNRNECKVRNNFLCNGTNKHFKVALEQADGFYDLEWGWGSDSGDPFPGFWGNTAFNFTTTPNTSSYNTGANLGVSVTQISSSGPTMTAKIGVDPIIQTPVTLALLPNNTLTKDATPTFTWNTLPNATKYQLQVDDDPGFGSPVITRQQAGTSFTPLTNLGNATWYWHVRASGSDNLWGPWSETWSVTVDRLKPVAPAPISPLPKEIVPDSTPFFQWSLVGDAVSYTLRIDRNNLFNSPDRRLYAGIGTNSFDMPDVLVDGRWFWQVAAIDAAGNQSPWSVKSLVLVDEIPAPIPTLISPADLLLTKDAVHTFQWSDESPNAVRYNIVINSEPSFTTRHRVNVNVKANSFRNGTLPLGNGTWYWQVRSQGPDGLWSPFSPYRTLFVDRVKPTRPTLFDPGNGTPSSGTPTFMWHAVPDTDVVGYVIQIDKNDRFANASPDKIQQSVAGTSYTPGISLYDRRWFWRVAAVDAAGNRGPWSPIWSVVVQTGAPVSSNDSGG